MTSFSDKISTNAGYCNDRTTTTKDGGFGNNETLYSTYSRNVSNKEPSYKCNNESNDLFTMNTNFFGNKKLTQPIGMITIDEVIYAGSILDTRNYKIYLHGRNSYWTLSPGMFEKNLLNVGIITIQGYVHMEVSNDNSRGLRPVIALNSKAIVTSGDGSLANPYIVEQRIFSFLLS